MKKYIIIGLICLVIVSSFSTISIGKTSQISTNNDKLYLKKVAACTIPDGMYPHIIRDGLAYCAGGTGGFEIVDITDLENPKVIGKYETELRFSDLYIQGDFVYLADDLLILDISDPTNPIYVTSFDGFSVYQVIANDKYVYTCDSSSNFRIFNIHDPDNPTNPELIGSISLPVSITDIKLYETNNGKYIVSTSLVDGLRIIDVRYPSEPKIVGSYPGNLLFQPYSIQIINNIVFIDDFYSEDNNEISGVKIFDISNLKNPQLISEYEIWYPGFVSVHENLLFTEGELIKESWALTDSIVVCDITDIYNPTPICYFVGRAGIGRVEIINDLIYTIKAGVIVVYEFTNENNPPKKPDFIGRKGSSRVGEDIEFLIVGMDKDNEDIYYEFKWDESGEIETFGPFSSGTEFIATHKWNSMGEKIIYGRIKDINGACSDWVSYDFYLSKSKPSFSNILLKIVKDFPILQRLLNL